MFPLLIRCGRDNHSCIEGLLRIRHFVSLMGLTSIDGRRIHLGGGASWLWSLATESHKGPSFIAVYYHQLAVSVSSVCTQIIINFCICLYSCQGMAFQLTTESGKKTNFSINGLVVSTDRQRGAHEEHVCV